MYKFLPLVTLTLLSLNLLAQNDEPGVAGIVLAVDADAIVENGSILGSSATALPATPCTAAPVSDVFYTFTSPTKAAVFTLNYLSFDGVIELWDNFGNAIECSDAAAGTADEVLFSNTLIPGDTYHIRVYSADGVSGAGTYNLEHKAYPLWELLGPWQGTSADGDNYRMYDYMRRSFDNDINCNLTRWKIRNLDTNVEVIYATPGNIKDLSLDDVEAAFGTLAAPFMCYGTSLAVSVEMKVDGYDCGYGPEQLVNFQTEPNTVLISSFINGVYDPGFDYLRAEKTHLDQVMEWELYEFGELHCGTVTAQGSRELVLNDVPGILYNRYYEVRVRVTSCGETGPWSPLYPFFTGDIPYVELSNPYCDTQVNTETVLWCTTTPLATSYFWQITPIEADDPTFTPIAPAQVIEENNNLNLSQIELTGGTAYRVGVKPVIANGAQIGDYGYFCQIGTSGSGVGFDLEDDTESNTNGTIIDFNNYAQFSSATNIKGGNALHSQIFPNPSNENNFKYVVSESAKEKSTITVHNSAGQVISEQTLSLGIMTGEFQLPESSGYGIYFVTICIDDKITREKLFYMN